MTSPFQLAKNTSSIFIIVFQAIHQSIGSEFAFRSQTYTTGTITLTPKHLLSNFDLKSTAFFDIRCRVTLVDKSWLSKCFRVQKINIMSTLLKVNGIRASKHKLREFAALSLYFSKKNNAWQLVYASLTYKIHIIKDLRANLLIDNNIISPESFVIDVKKGNVLIKSCKVTVLVNARQKGQFLTKKPFTS